MFQKVRFESLYNFSICACTVIGISYGIYDGIQTVKQVKRFKTTTPSTSDKFKIMVVTIGIETCRGLIVGLTSPISIPIIGIATIVSIIDTNDTKTNTSNVSIIDTNDNKTDTLNCKSEYDYEEKLHKKREIENRIEKQIQRDHEDWLDTITKNDKK